MKIYVGRWDLLPEEWEGINGLEKASEKEVEHELNRELDTMLQKYHEEDNRIAIYTPKEFEAEFNYDTKGQFSTETYWIKIF